jgi:hypothetical protein
MATKHYYAMRTPMGNNTTWANTDIPVGTVVMFAKKRERNEWVEANAYDPSTGNAHQTMTLTAHEARVTMLRQHGREMCAWNNRTGLAWTYREYAQYCPTAVMVDDYNQVIGLVE